MRKKYQARSRGAIWMSGSKAALDSARARLIAVGLKPERPRPE
jgi:hypothetical protein